MRPIANCALFFGKQPVSTRQVISRRRSFLAFKSKLYPLYVCPCSLIRHRTARAANICVEFVAVINFLNIAILDEFSHTPGQESYAAVCEWLFSICANCMLPSRIRVSTKLRNRYVPNTDSTGSISCLTPGGDFFYWTWHVTSNDRIVCCLAYINLTTQFRWSYSLKSDNCHEWIISGIVKSVKWFNVDLAIFELEAWSASLSICMYILWLAKNSLSIPLDIIIVWEDNAKFSGKNRFGLVLWFGWVLTP